MYKFWVNNFMLISSFACFGKNYSQLSTACEEKTLWRISLLLKFEKKACCTAWYSCWKLHNGYHRVFDCQSKDCPVDDSKKVEWIQWWNLGSLTLIVPIRIDRPNLFVRYRLWSQQIKVHSQRHRSVWVSYQEGYVKLHSVFLIQDSTNYERQEERPRCKAFQQP